MWKRLLAQLFGKEVIKSSYGIITSIEIQKLLPIKKEKSKMIYLTHPHNHTTDYVYSLSTKQQIEDFLKKDNTSWYKYKEEKFDCDDFAIVLLGRLKEAFPNFAIGLALSNTHAFNFFIDEKKKLWIIEPQTDKIFQTTSSKYVPFTMCLI